MEIETDEFKRVKKEVIERASKKDYRKSRLVLIGRGWVKAGFDFGEFTGSNFRYDKSRNRIHFIGLQPQIISATINPWFIPEEGVEGFEFLIAERGARLKPVYTKMVKQRCLDKLQQQALDKRILVRSQKNAETHLKAFFSLLLNEDIAGVYFHTDFLDYTLDVILDDSVIRNEEVYTIDSSICYFYDTYKEDDRLEKIAAFIDTLQKAGTSFYGEEFVLNGNSSLLFSIIKDRVIDSADLFRIAVHSNLHRLDTLWYSRLFTDRYFNREKDTLPAKEKFKIDSAFNVSTRGDNTLFCKELGRMIKKIGIEADSTDFGSGRLQIVIRQDTCVVF